MSEFTTIRISKDLNRRLLLYKINNKYKSIADVLRNMIDSAEKNSMVFRIEKEGENIEKAI